MHVCTYTHIRFDWHALNESELYVCVHTCTELSMCVYTQHVCVHTSTARAHTRAHNRLLLNFAPEYVLCVCVCVFSQSEYVTQTKTYSVCVCVCARAYLSLSIYIHTHTHMHARTHAHTRAHTHTHTHAHKQYTHMCEYIYPYITQYQNSVSTLYTS